MSHPSSCTDPSCTLSYAAHLRTINFSASALPTRRVNRTPGQPDEPVAHTLVRERRWDRDMGAFKRLADDGLTPPQIDGSALRERHGETPYDVTERKVTIDYTDPR